MKIIPFEEKYRDDMIFMVLEAKDALGRRPRLNEDLLDVKKNYPEAGGAFFLALNEEDRVIGCGGFSPEPGSGRATVHRLYVKARLKRQGIGSALLETVEDAMRGRGIREALVHLGSPAEQWFESRAFYKKHGYLEYEPDHVKKEL